MGLGHDVAAIQITPHQPARLNTTALGIYPTAPQWGGTLSVTAQISNTSYGDAPATRAQVVLTPAGVTPGGSSDVTIGSIAVPPVAAWQTVNVEQTITLPVTPPLAAGRCQPVHAQRHARRRLTSPMASTRTPRRGVPGTDQTTVNINVPPGTTPPALGSLPDLAAGAVTASAKTLFWGHSFQAQAAVQNLGTTDPGPFRVRFLLVGASGNTSNGLFLGDSIVQGLPGGGSQLVTQTLTLPYRLPAGITLSSLGHRPYRRGPRPRERPQRDLQEQQHRHLRPHHPAAPGDRRDELRAQPAAARAALARLRPPGRPSATLTTTAAGKKLFRKAPPHQNSLLHNLSVFPSRVNNLLKKYI